VCEGSERRVMLGRLVMVFDSSLPMLDVAKVASECRSRNKLPPGEGRASSSCRILSEAARRRGYSGGAATTVCTDTQFLDALTFRGLVERLEAQPLGRLALPALELFRQRRSRGPFERRACRDLTSLMVATSLMVSQPSETTLSGHPSGSSCGLAMPCDR